MPDEACATSPDHGRDGQSVLPDGLVLVSTPIGNLGDLTLRARETLLAADLILCEDTRHTARLLSAIGAKVKLQPLHEHNEDAAIPAVLARLREGRRIALVSDAGVPLISDPGYRLVRAALAEGLPVGAVPGANAAVTAWFCRACRRCRSWCWAFRRRARPRAVRHSAGCAALKGRGWRRR